MALKHQFKLSLLLSIADMAKSTYYYWVKKLNKPDKYRAIKQEILQIVKESNYRYGYRRVTITLRQKGWVINHKTVRKLMNSLGVSCKLREKRYKSYRGTVGRICKNILSRDFIAKKPNQKWATDVTEFNVCNQKVYLSTIIDLFNSEIIAYTIYDRPVYQMVGEMIESAINTKSITDSLVLHSDQGWHYQMKYYQKLLKENNIIQSMSRKGNCLDNAVMENFFGILKSEFFYPSFFSSVNDFKEKLKEYIDWYNNKRIKIKLNGLSPVEYRKQSV